MRDDDLIWNSLPRQERESLARLGLRTRQRKKAANQRARERKRKDGVVRMEVLVRAQDRADLRKLIAFYTAAREAGEAVQVRRVPMPDGSAGAILFAHGANVSAKPTGPRGLKSTTLPSTLLPSARSDDPNLTERQARFFLDSYTAELTEIIAGIVRLEGPLPLDLLERKVARQHGWHRAGEQISARIRGCLAAVECHDEGASAFVWEKGAHAARVPYRSIPGRTLREISRHELADLLDRNAAALDAAADPLREFARLAGVGRFTESAAVYLQECLAWWKANPV